ncbi:hypothetical protein GQ42DRAFT_168779, partial [Ramicandelaber brevisporus]
FPWSPPKTLLFLQVESAFIVSIHNYIFIFLNKYYSRPISMQKEQQKEQQLMTKTAVATSIVLPQPPVITTDAVADSTSLTAWLNHFDSSVRQADIWLSSICSHLQQQQQHKQQQQQQASSTNSAANGSDATAIDDVESKLRGFGSSVHVIKALSSRIRSLFTASQSLDGTDEVAGDGFEGERVRVQVPRRLENMLTSWANAWAMLHHVKASVANEKTKHDLTMCLERAADDVQNVAQAICKLDARWKKRVVAFDQHFETTMNSLRADTPMYLDGKHSAEQILAISSAALHESQQATAAALGDDGSSWNRKVTDLGVWLGILWRRILRAFPNASHSLRTRIDHVQRQFDALPSELASVQQRVRDAKALISCGSQLLVLQIHTLRANILVSTHRCYPPVVASKYRSEILNAVEELMSAIRSALQMQQYQQQQLIDCFERIEQEWHDLRIKLQSVSRVDSSSPFISRIPRPRTSTHTTFGALSDTESVNSAKLRHAYTVIHKQQQHQHNQKQSQMSPRTVTPPSSSGTSSPAQSSPQPERHNLSPSQHPSASPLALAMVSPPMHFYRPDSCLGDGKHDSPLPPLLAQMSPFQSQNEKSLDPPSFSTVISTPAPGSRLSSFTSSDILSSTVSRGRGLSCPGGARAPPKRRMPIPFNKPSPPSPPSLPSPSAPPRHTRATTASTAVSEQLQPQRYSQLVSPDLAPLIFRSHSLAMDGTRMLSQQQPVLLFPHLPVPPPAPAASLQRKQPTAASSAADLGTSPSSKKKATSWLAKVARRTSFLTASYTHLTSSSSS